MLAALLGVAFAWSLGFSSVLHCRLLLSSMRG
jgi:hypothetical protein